MPGYSKKVYSLISVGEDASTNNSLSKSVCALDIVIDV